MTLSTRAAAVSSGNAWLRCIFSRPPSVLCKVQGVSQERLAGLAVIRGWLSGPQAVMCVPVLQTPTEPFMSCWDGVLQPASSYRHSQRLHWQTDEWMSRLYVWMTGRLIRLSTRAICAEHVGIKLYIIIFINRALFKIHISECFAKAAK